MNPTVQPPYPAPPPPPGLTPFPLSIQLKMKRFHGHLFLAANRIYFVCDKAGSAWGAAIGQSIGGLVGGAIAAIGTPGYSDSPGIVDEGTVYQAVTQREGSLIMEAAQITMIKHTWAWRLIKWNGNTIGLPQGMDKGLRVAIGQWATYHNVPHKGSLG